MCVSAYVCLSLVAWVSSILLYVHASYHPYSDSITEIVSVLHFTYCLLKNVVVWEITEQSFFSFFWLFKSTYYADMPGQCRIL